MDEKSKKNRPQGNDNEILQLQRTLGVLGYYKGHLTGIIDEATKEAIHKFQEERLPEAKSAQLSDDHIDPEIASAIFAQYEEHLSRLNFGVPGLDPSQVLRLQIMGINSLPDILRYDPEQLKILSMFDNKQLMQLRQMAEISQVTGLSPQSSYVLVEVGKITNRKKLQQTSKDELKDIFEVAKNEGLLSDQGTKPRELFLESFAQSKRETYLDIRRFFSSESEEIAEKLAGLDILQGSDLRSMDIDKISGAVDISKEDLQTLKHAAELMQICAINPEVAHILVKDGEIQGIKGLASLEASDFDEKLDSLAIDENTKKSLKNGTRLILSLAQSATCDSNICSDRKYLDYLVKTYAARYYDGDFEQALDALTGAFRQDYRRTETDNNTVLLLTVVVDVLEKVIVSNLEIYLQNVELNIPPEVPNQANRTRINELISSIPSDPTFYSVIPNTSPWHYSRLPLPDTLIGSMYVQALMDLFWSIRDRSYGSDALGYPTADSRATIAKILSRQYKINILCGQHKRTTWLGQAILTLQNNMYARGISFKKRNEWCNEEQIMYYPENYISCKKSNFQNVDWDNYDHQYYRVDSELRNTTYEISYDSVNFLQNMLAAIQDIRDGDARLHEANSKLSMSEFSLALNLYDQAEEAIFKAFHTILNPRWEADLYFNQDFSLMYRLEDLVGEGENKLRRYGLKSYLLNKIKNGWDLEYVRVATYSAKHRYEKRQTYIIANVDALGYFNLILPDGGIYGLHTGGSIAYYLKQALETINYEDYFYIYISLACDLGASLLLHYLFYVFPIARGDTLTQMGNFAKAYAYYNIVYDLDAQYLDRDEYEWAREIEGYPYLNPQVDIPLIKIKHGANFIDWADSLYRENTSESIVESKNLYERVLQLHDDCIASNEDQFAAMSRAIYALTNLQYDTFPESASMRQILQEVANLQYRQVPSQEISSLYAQLEQIARRSNGEQTATGLSKVLPSNVRFSEARQVLVVEKSNTNVATRSSSSSLLTDNVELSSVPFLRDVLRRTITQTLDPLPPLSSCKPPCNPVIQKQIQTARMRLAQIERCLNVLGYSDEMLPVLRFEYLVNQAKYFVSLAVAAEKDFIQFLSNAESGEYDLLMAQQALAIATANVRIEQARINAAQLQIGVAKLQKDKLGQEVKDLGDEITNASDPIFALAEWAQAYDEYAGAFSTSSSVSFGIGLAGPSMGGSMGFSTSGTFYNQLSRGGIGRDMSEFFGARGPELTETPVETRRQARAKARRNQIKKLKRQEALLQTYGLAISQAQVDQAVAEHEIAQRQLAIAQLRVEHAQQILTFLQTKFLNKELWYDLAKEIHAIYRKYLDYAITTAFLAEQALEYEMNQRFNVIRFDYFKRSKQGLLGAENLQQDITTLEYQRIVLTEEKKIPVKAVISLAEEYPIERLRFIQTGKAHFATDFGQFDLLSPGVYQSRINRVEVVVEGLVPSEGIHGTLSTSGISYVRTRENQIQPLAGNPETMILSSYTIRGDQVVFSKTDEALELFEGLGTITDWTIEMPKEANNMNYQTITDVKLVIYYTAFYDDNLRNLLQKWRPKGGDAYLTFSMRFQFPDAFYHFVNDVTQNGANYEATLNFETLKAFFPSNQESRRIANLSIAAVSDDALPAPVDFDLSSTPLGGVDTIVESDRFEIQPGFKHIQASSNIDVIKADGTPETPKHLNAFAGIGVDRKWELQLNLDPTAYVEFFPTNTAGDVVPDLSKIVDILFSVEYRYDRQDLIIAEHFTDGAFNWPVGAPDRVGNWQISDATYQGSMQGAEEAQSRLDINAALATFPAGNRDELKNLIADNVMIAFRTKISTGVGHNNDSRFYFANGHYLLRLERETGSTKLMKLGTSYDPTTATLLSETRNDEFLLKADRWYHVEVGKFGSRIEVVIDGAIVFDVPDNDPQEGPGIAVGTYGGGFVYFDDILI